MKVLIQDDDSGLYLSHQERWTEDPKQARDFAFSIHAASVARKLGLRKFQIYFFFNEIDYKISVFKSGQSEAA